MTAFTRLRRAVSVVVTTVALAGALAGCALNDGLDAGRTAPALDVDTWVVAPGGRLYEITALRGKPVLVQFWSSLCPHCRDNVAEIKRLHSTYGPRGLEVVSVHVPMGDRDVSPRDVAQFAAEYGITYAIGYDADGSATDAYEFGYLPHGALIGTDGRIAWAGSLSMYDVEDEIRALLGDTAYLGGPREATALAGDACLLDACTGTGR